jgi:GNAT superfamily N-acetyltransferase
LIPNRLELKRLDPDDPRPEFCCGDNDIDEFFAVDSIASGKELMSVTYVFVREGSVRAFFSVSNDSIKKELCPRSAFERLQKIIPRTKRYSSMPTTKIGRIGICQEDQGSGLGTEILGYLKYWFTRNNKTGCRFLVVDAYNKPKVLSFYEKNGFRFLAGRDEKDETRIMYFDLKTFVK